MADSILTDAEKRLLSELEARGVRYLVVGMSAALLQGARGSTEDIDLWFEDPTDPRIGEAVRAIIRIEGGEKRDVWTARMSEEKIEILTLGDESLREWATELIQKGKAQRDPSITGPWELARSLGVELPAYRAYDD